MSPRLIILIVGNNLRTDNAVAAIRVSSIKQGALGDSPEDQKEQLERFANLHDLKIKKYFIFLESASKDQQPIQEAIDYCKNPKNNIQVLLVKSIDRFTRGGSYLYEELKTQLEKSHVRLQDIYGVISEKEVNTLEHLGVEYTWSKYSPTKKSEILEAERAKDEKRDIMTRMIGAEIRYCRLGYWVRMSPMGFKNEKVETQHGKRTILVPHPAESVWIIRMFDLMARGTLSEERIVDEVNALGFKTPIRYIRNSQDRTKIIRRKGGNKLTVKGLQAYIRNPVYAGIIYQVWTRESPVKGRFDGLVTVEMFNKVNRGRIEILEEAGQIRVVERKPGKHSSKRMANNPDYPFKRVVLCPICRGYLYGSASRGRLGNYYPAYHCSKGDHYFRVPKAEFDKTIENFVRNVRLNPKHLKKLVEITKEQLKKRKENAGRDQENNTARVKALKAEAESISNAMKYTTSGLGLKIMDGELNKIEKEISDLTERASGLDAADLNDSDIEIYVNYFANHIWELLLAGGESVTRASGFALLFDELPTYDELASGEVKLDDMFVFSKSSS